MPHSFQIVALDHQQFTRYFEMPDDELRQLGIVRRIADESPGFQCRVSLEDAKIGDELILLSYLHQSAASPYRASGPVYVRRSAKQARLPQDVLPPYATRLLISMRAYDAEHMMLQANVVDGTAAKMALETLLQSEQVAYVQLHNAKQGCFTCQVNRA